MRKIELLAPAGSLAALEAAVESGADAVYIGGTKFNARAFADNADDEMLKKAVEYAHIRGVKVYVTVNILILQKELEEVIEYIKYLYSIYVDAVIVQDIGLAVMIKRLLPDFDVHCSTQMAIHNEDGARLLYELGIKRVVLARELSLKEVNEISQETGIDAEIFVHGALCVCYSGQCYMSSLIGGRSGNRGKCAQPCRKKYRLYDTNIGQEIPSDGGSYLISTRDLNTYDNLYDIAASEAASLKIEGRMKRPEYVAIIVHNYRKALDCIEKGNKDCISEQAAYELKIAFNREFTQGYLFNKRNQEIVYTERPDNKGIYLGHVVSQKGNMVEIQVEDNYLNDGDSIEIILPGGKSAGGTISGIKLGNMTVKAAKAGDLIRVFLTDRVTPGSIVNKTIDSLLFQKAREEYAYKNKKQIGVKGTFTGRYGQVPVLEIEDGDGNRIGIVGDEHIQKAEKVAVTKEKIEEQLNKTKDTPYYFEELDINMDDNCFLSVKAINNLRREAIDQITNKRISPYPRKMIEADIRKEIVSYSESFSPASATGNELIVGITSLEAGISAIKGGADVLYILGSYRYNEDLQLIEGLVKYCSNANCKLYYVMPQITRNAEARAIEAMLMQCMEQYHELGLVISNLGHIKMAERLKPAKLRGNFTINATNSAAAAFMIRQGMESMCVSPELNLTQIKELHKSVDINLEAMVYGYLPAMITEYCPTSSALKCDACKRCNENQAIMDERNKLFRLINMGNCKTTVLNSDVLCAFDHLYNIVNSGITRLRLDFYIEDPADIYEIVAAYKTKMQNLLSNDKNDVIEDLKKNGYTKGHYFRGIE